ncbi:sugar phosphate isomerase/epimerase family protein [Clostridium vitabionis]|uniref:sugar phosphate isomerase/epimerase family protein n=1 Tax=Clostridium vitabionis TaxID=2784388 RepID=UPI00188DA855|nr:sugar phosphate isomerase/epimerase [Clostridium vitabionis]
MSKNRIYISTLCIKFEDYEWLKTCLDNFHDFPVGIEHATWWKLQPKLPDLLDTKKPLFYGMPTTIHAPFHEICNIPGSPEEKEMLETFNRACRVYHECNATSMVMHTNENHFPEIDLPAMRARSKEMILFWHERFKAQGIRMTVENVGFPKKDNLLFDYPHFIQLFNELPDDIGCLIDTGHAMLNNWDIPALIKTLGSRIRGYHLNNNDGVNDAHYPTFAPDGFLPPEKMEEIIATIAQYSPDADLILEYMFGDRISEEQIHSDIRHVANLIEENRRKQP